MWDLLHSKQPHQLGDHRGVVSSLAVVEKDGVTRLLTAGADCTIKFWEP